MFGRATVRLGIGPHSSLDYSCVVWSPILKDDIYKIETVQRQFAKRLYGLHNLAYSCRLVHLGLDSVIAGVLNLA